MDARAGSLLVGLPPSQLDALGLARLGGGAASRSATRKDNTGNRRFVRRDWRLHHLEIGSARSMKRTHSGVSQLFLFLFALACTFFILQRIGSLFTASSDLAFHAELAERLASGLGSKARLHEHSPPWMMPIYPLYGHALAAIVSLLCDSPVIAVNFVSLVAVIIAWTSWIAASQALPRRIMTMNCLSLAGLFLLNDDYLHLEVFGQEIVVNFFYAQLVGNALACAVVAVAIILDRRREPAYFRYPLLAGSALLLTNVYLLTALQVLAYLALVVVADAAKAGRRGVRVLFVGTAAIVASLSLILSGPQLRSMIANAGNDGSLSIHYAREPRDVLILAVVVALISLAWLARWSLLTEGQRHLWAYARGISLFGLATSGLCIIQYIALQLGYGSAYAVKKYAFALNSAGLVMVALTVAVVAAWVTQRLRATRWRGGRIPLSAGACLMAGALLCARSFDPANQTIDVSQLARAERLVRASRETVLGDPAPPQQDYAIDALGINLVADFYLSAVSLGAPFDDNAIAILTGRPPPHPEDARYILTSIGADFWDVPACRRILPVAGMVFVEASCVMKSAIPNCEGVLDLSTRGWFSPYAIEGMSIAESFGRWSEGARASFTCKIADRSSAPQLLKLVTRAFLPNGRTQRLVVSVGGGEPATYVYDGANPTREVALTIPALAAASGRLHVSFEFPDAVSPKEAGVNDDIRRIAIAFSQISFE
jgi:hypothetical protein